MNDIDLVAGLRAGVPEPASARLAAGRARLTAAIGAGNTRVTTRSPGIRPVSGRLRAATWRAQPEAVVATGLVWRRRRLAGLLVAGAAAVTAAILAVSGVIGPAPGRSTATVRTVAFTLVSHANDTATLTINPGVLVEPGTLQSDLAQDGIAAKVTVGSFCSSDPALPDLLRVVSLPTGGNRSTITINPAAMPAGAELSFGEFQLSSGTQQAAIELIDADSYTCSSSLPTAPPPGSETFDLFGS